MSDTKVVFENGIAVVKITDWLDSAAGINTHRIVLPMIQRGSVWKPHQVMDLWDTLLRGMPLGSMMASQAGQDMQCFHPITRELEVLAEQGGLSLLDGQQRTLSMLLAWPAIGQRMNRRLWVDLGENDKSDHLFRFHFSTEQHPFGFQRAGQSGSSVNKLSRSDRRKALAAYANLLQRDSTGATTGTTRQLFAHQDVRPWQGTLPIDLQWLIALFNEGAEAFKNGIQQQRRDLKNWLAAQINQEYGEQLDERLRKDIDSHFERQLKALKEMAQDDFDKRTERLFEALTKFFKQHMPIIEVPYQVFVTDDDNDDQDPALAVLFQRVGTGGTALSNADYVFSVIKQRSPQCHALVEDLLKDEKIAALFTPVTLVTTAVRLTAAKLGLTDHLKIDKAQFARLLRGDAKNGNTDFLSEFASQIKQDGEFSHLLKALIDEISYTRSGDIGLPKHALCLLDIPALEIALRWLQMQNDPEAAMAGNRKALIRFMLYCALAVTNLPKASELVFKTLKEQSLGGADDVFPDRSLIKMLAKENLAYPMYAPDDYRCTLRKMIFTPDDEVGLRGWSRFDINFVGITAGLPEEKIVAIEQAIRLYQKWWNRKNSYAHSMLLWLQRDYVHQKFESIPALPGMEDETPYDFDHICPQNHWYYWTGSTGENRLIDFRHQGDGNHGAESLLGNSIGNVRAWCSSDNRSDGESPPALKLRLKEQDEQSCELLTESAIAQPAADWLNCSFANGRENELRYWDASRAQAFQRAIEQRAFTLYERFYTELAFGEH
jgi:hypothetical protein